MVRMGTVWKVSFDSIIVLRDKSGIISSTTFPYSRKQQSGSALNLEFQNELKLLSTLASSESLYTVRFKVISNFCPNL